MASRYSALDRGARDYEITGKVKFGMSYTGGQLCIHVEQATGLAAVKQHQYCDPYVKTYLLPDRTKKTKLRIKVKKKTTSPMYNETLKVSRVSIM